MLHNQRSAILYQSADREITLIDIPLSIALAQGRDDTLLSTPPLQTPIQTKEEYQQKPSKTKTAQRTDTTHHEIYKPLISQALLDIKAHVSGSWCLPRQILAADKKDAEKELEQRFREWAATHEEANTLDPSFDFQTMMASLGAPDAQPLQKSAQWTMTTSPANGTASQITTTTSSWDPSFYNASPTHLHLSLSHPTNLTSHAFTLPPFSAYSLTNCENPDSFRTAFRALTLSHSLPRSFPLILLDPPWPNRSAKRKHAYEQIGGMPYLKKLLLRMDIDEYLAPGGVVGVWVTNKVGVRECVLGEGGLFERWGVGLCEEWVWVKTTTGGECMFDVEDQMRKPYEVLLLGRRKGSVWMGMGDGERVKRRVVAAVPDVHSRKPCLKELLEGEKAGLGLQEGAPVLEVFARYTVEGWWSWGNEVLKFNEVMYWAKEDVEACGIAN